MIFPEESINRFCFDFSVPPTPRVIYLYDLLFVYLFFAMHQLAIEILILQPGTEPMPLQWKHGDLTTGPPGKSPCV